MGLFSHNLILASIERTISTQANLVEHLIRHVDKADDPANLLQAWPAKMQKTIASKTLNDFGRNEIVEKSKINFIKILF